MGLIHKLFHKGHVDHIRENGFSALVLNTLLSQLVVTMVSSFGIIFIYQLGSGFVQGLTYLLLYYVAQRFVVAMAIPIVGYLTTKYGYRLMMTMGLVSLALRLLVLSFVTVNNLLLLIPALIFGGIFLAGYFMPFHGLFLEENDDDRVGEEIGYITMLQRIATVISPFFAGLVVERFGFQVLFVVSLLVLLVSLAPLYLMPHHLKRKEKFRIYKAFGLMGKQKKASASVLLWYFQDSVQTFFWPIFMIILLSDYVTFGAINSTVMVISALTIFIVGKIYDKKQARNLFIGSSIMVGITWILRFLSTGVFSVAAADSLNRLSSPGWWMKIRRNALMIGERVDGLVFAAWWEYLVTIGYVLGLFTSYILLVLTKGTWLSLLLVALVGLFGSAKLMIDEQ